MGDWKGNCSDPKELYEKLAVPLEDMVDYMQFQFFISSEVKHFDRPHVSFNWSKITLDHQRCYTLESPREFVKFGISRMVFQFKTEVEFYIHSPGLLKSGYPKKVAMEPQKSVNFVVKHDIFHMLDYLGEPCIDDPDYVMDDCNEDLIYSQSMEKLGCTSPFGKNIDNICHNETVGTMAFIMYTNHLKKLRYMRLKLACRFKCYYLTVDYFQDLVRKSELPSIHLEFQEKVTCIQSQYSYSELSLIAEIGGYVGLFLGVSVNQVSGIINAILAKLRHTNCSL